MREPGEGKQIPVPSHTSGAQRKRRLARGIQRWDLDAQLCAEPTRRIATITLTIPEKEPEAAVGRVYRFWRQVRQRWLGARYFCWLELQARGAVHYHCVWLNPPALPHKEMYAWVDRAWGPGRTQYRVHYERDALRKEIDYAVSYAKKLGRKSYQQRYDAVPRQLRTFMSQRLEIPPAVLDEHRDRDVWQYWAADTVADPRVRGLLVERPPSLLLVGSISHVVPAGGRCSALDWRRSKRAPPARARPGG